MKIIIFLVIIFTNFSGCTMINGGKELEEIVRTIQENVKRYGTSSFHTQKFLQCDVFDECKNPNYIFEHSIQKNYVSI